MMPALSKTDSPFIFDGRASTKPLEETLSVLKLFAHSPVLLIPLLVVTKRTDALQQNQLYLQPLAST
jgi:hypothetical protein